MKTYKIVYTPAAVEHIKDITRWYNKASKGLGKRFKTSLKASLENIRLNPFAHAIRYGNVRFAVPEKFPYSAHYTVDVENFTIIIHAVFGFKENPEKWKRNL